MQYRDKCNPDDIKRINGIFELLESSLSKFKDNVQRSVVSKLCQRFMPDEFKAWKRHKKPNKSSPKHDVPKDKILRVVEYCERKVKAINPNAKPDKDNSYIFSLDLNQHLKAHSRLAIFMGSDDTKLRILNVNVQPKGKELPPLYDVQSDYYEFGWLEIADGCANPIVLIDGKYVENLNIEIRLTGRKSYLHESVYKYIYNDLIKTNLWARDRLLVRRVMLNDKLKDCVIFSRKHIDMLDIDIKNIKRNCYQVKRYESIETFRGQGDGQ